MNKESVIQDQHINKPVFFSSFLFILLITAGASFAPDSFKVFFESIQGWLTSSASWVYVLSVAIFTIIIAFLMFSRLGDIKLGPDHSNPEYTNISWFAMLFSAGMGIGLLFFGVAEPIMHFSAPPVGEPQSIVAAKEAMKITFFHWGLHAWAIYSLLAVMLAYFCYRKDLPLLPRTLLYPFIGDKIYGPLGHMIDTFSIIGTMFGVATSLGFGVTQVNAGLSYLFELPQSVTVQVILIAVITSFATISVVLGLDVKLHEGEDYIELAVKKGDFDDFKYGIKARTFTVPDYVPDEKDAYCRAEVFLLNGGQDYDVYGYEKEQILVDAIAQYEKHFQYLHTLSSEKI